RRRVHRQAPQHALRAARRSGLPRTRRPPHAGARDRARSRRYTRPRRAGELPGSKPRGQATPHHPQLIRYHAAWIVPIEGEPIRDGWVMVDGGRVVALGRRAANDSTPGVELGDVAVMPGLVNA